MATCRPLRMSVARKMDAMPLRATNAFDAVVVELVAGMECHVVRRDALAGRQRLAQLVRPAPIHSHAFHASNSDQLNAYIITAIALVRNVHQPLGRRIQIAALARQPPPSPEIARSDTARRKHSSSTSPGYTWMSLVSTLTNSSVPERPAEDVARWDDSAASLAVSSPRRTCSCATV